MYCPHVGFNKVPLTFYCPQLFVGAYKNNADVGAAVERGGIVVAQHTNTAAQRTQRTMPTMMAIALFDTAGGTVASGGATVDIATVLAGVLAVRVLAGVAVAGIAATQRAAASPRPSVLKWQPSRL